MSFFRKALIATSLAAVMAGGSYVWVAAASKSQGNPETANNVTALLQERLDVKILSVQPAPIDGLHEVFTDKGVFYLSPDGSKLLDGRIYSIEGKPDDLTERSFARVRLEMMNEFKASAIEFPAKEEKHAVTVFTDIDCGYCRKLHKQIEEYNDLGITVRYLAYPRAGVNSSSGEQITAVWCAEDPQAAMTNAKNGKPVQAANCESPVPEHYSLGRTLGVRGTPAIIREDGRMVPGYVPPMALLHKLETE